MKKNCFMIYVLLLVAICLAGCIFGDDEKKTDELGWKKTSLPKELSGTWYFNDIPQFKITDTSVVIDNRKWGIESVHKKDDEIRLICSGQHQYRAFYFRNIRENSVERSYGSIKYELYEAKTAYRDSWRELTKDAG